MTAIRDVPLVLSARLSILDLDAIVRYLQLNDPSNVNEINQQCTSTHFLFTLTSRMTPERSRDQTNFYAH